MGNGNDTVFRFSSDGVDLEFAGSESFVEKQLARFQKFLRGSVGLTEATPEPAAAAAPAPATEPLETFYANRPVREGRGAIQDRILLFIYYLQKVQGKREVANPSP